MCSASDSTYRAEDGFCHLGEPSSRVKMLVLTAGALPKAGGSLHPTYLDSSLSLSLQKSTPPGWCGGTGCAADCGVSAQHPGGFGSSLHRRCSASPQPSYFSGNPIIGTRALWKGEK